MTILVPMLKNSVFITVLLLLGASNVMAQTDSLKVYLEKDDNHKFGVNLVFENNYQDTVYLRTKFHNLSFGGEIPQYPGVCIWYYFDNEPFTFSWGDMPTSEFIFFDGYALIAPNSKIKLFFNPGKFYRFPNEADGKYEVNFLINSIFTKYRSSELPKFILYYETNRVTIFEPPKEEAAKDNPCPD